jgi:hypothetical protein
MIILLIVLILVFGFGAIEWDLIRAITEAAVKRTEGPDVRSAIPEL